MPATCRYTTLQNTNKPKEILKVGQRLAKLSYDKPTRWSTDLTCGAYNNKSKVIWEEAE